MSVTQQAITTGRGGGNVTLPRASKTLAASAKPGCPDAELIAACDDFTARVEDYNAGRGDDAEYGSLCEAEDATLATIPATLDGIAAKARVALALAIMDGKGGEEWDNGPATNWAAAVVHDVLRMAGGMKA